MESCGLVLVVDPDADCRASLRSLLELITSEVRLAATAAEARAAFTDAVPALVLLEVDLPDASGYEVCRELHDAYGADLPVIFLAVRRTDAADRVAGLLLGADDYIVKPFDPDELLARVRRSLRRAAPTRSQADGQPKGSVSERLTPRELQVLTLMARGLGQKQIAAELFLSPKTVATHIQHVLEKLGVHSRAQAVVIAHRDGLVYP